MSTQSKLLAALPNSRILRRAETLFDEGWELGFWQAHRLSADQIASMCVEGMSPANVAMLKQRVRTLEQESKT